ncbi:hypothetical protein [Desulfobacter postgatei]|uniref:VRR-NUC domain-containing protein n=1 Tax=Desulfobacter postgatei 2ac9 TaxID=879212 RepID=I5B7K9_9BACT|nr:hypothetical protein [Desulfobacter postgatei]EIM65472.1 VRR-NUC domain-containing protein [Desulfobacter postgatei 2ac9]
MRNKKAVIDAGIPIEQLKLIAVKREKLQWKYGEKGKLCNIEDACIEAMRDKGWNGFHDEGGALRILIKCAALPDIAKMNIKNHYPNAGANFYYNSEHPTLPLHEFTGMQLLENITNATNKQILKNIKFLQVFQSGRPINTMPFSQFLHPSSEKFLMEMFNHVGIKRLYEIAKLVCLQKKMPKTALEHKHCMGTSRDLKEIHKWKAAKPDRFSFPDLTLIGNQGIKFFEVKSPSDKVSPFQINAFIQVLFPLGLSGVILEVLKA